MKILFINPDNLGMEYILLGLCYLSSTLKEKGHKTYLYNYTFKGSIKKNIDYIKKIQPDIIGFTVDAGRFEFSIKIAKEIKKELNIPILFGGIHPTVSPDEVISKECVDMICIGESEEALAELLEKLENKKYIYKTRNFWFKKDGKIIKNPIRPLIQNLDSLPFPDRKLFKLKNSKKITISIMTGRGCPYQCSYCVNHTLQKIYKGKGKYVRKRSVKNVIDEIMEIQRESKIDYIEFFDDTFTIYKEWTMKFCEEYKHLKIPFRCCIRIGTVDEETLIALKNAGCESVAVGVEEGNQKLRNSIMKRNMTNKQIIEFFEITHKIGLSTFSLNMVGTPYQNQDKYWETVELNRKIKPTFLQADIFQPYPKTDLEKLCRKKGWITEEKMPITIKLKSIVDYPYTTKKQIKWNKKLFRFRVLRKYNLKKAMIMLMFDLNYDLYTKIRRFIPYRIREVMSSINRKFRK